VYQILADGTTVTIDGGVSLRVDLQTDPTKGITSLDNQVGFTVLSSKNSTLYYSNNWAFDTATSAWKTKTQKIKSGCLVVS
jgi:hypothetical protein